MRIQKIVWIFSVLSALLGVMAFARESGTTPSLEQVEMRMVESLTSGQFEEFLSDVRQYRELGGPDVVALHYFEAVALREIGEVETAIEQVGHYLEAASESDANYRRGKQLQDALDADMNFNTFLREYYWELQESPQHLHSVGMAAEYGNVLAAAEFTRFLWQGILMEANQEEAREYAAGLMPYLLALAERGDPHAQFLLGRFHGLEILRDSSVELMSDWYKQASQQDYAPALNNYAVAFLQGRGVNQCGATAAMFFRAAADQGYPVAQYNLGVLYSDGEGVERDHEKAVELFRKAAEKGHEEARRNLADSIRKNKQKEFQ